MSHISPAGPFARRWLVAAAALLTTACGDTAPTASESLAPSLPRQALQALDCEAVVATGAVTCGAPRTAGARKAVIGGQGTYVQLTSSNLVSTPADGPSETPGTLEFDVTVQNLLNEAIGTPDGMTLDTAGIKVFFYEVPTTTQGEGAVWVDNADGEAIFLGPEVPFFRYDEVLARDQVSAAKPWRFAFDPLVERFVFKVYVAAEVQPLLVINELLANPGGTCPPVCDGTAEWFEVYNAGTLPVDMRNMVIADSANSGRRPFHLIASSLPVAPGGYVVLGNNANTTDNGGVPVDYTYGSALAFANSLDALKISRVYGNDTLTIDRTQYASAAISAQNGISRELRNPALDNSNMDGSNWDNASVTSVYGNGGRGTPRAQNSTYTP